MGSIGVTELVLVFVILLLMLSALWPIGRLGSEFMPELDEGEAAGEAKPVDMADLLTLGERVAALGPDRSDGEPGGVSVSGGPEPGPTSLGVVAAPGVPCRFEQPRAVDRARLAHGVGTVEPAAAHGA